ncbi:MAG: hypothetical protein JNN01_09880 [Opitutaceae bacterium]|nr:hypothetical protein [Opitutaceae bacterium]
MSYFPLLILGATFVLSSARAAPTCVVEGRVTLPTSDSAPVVQQRYEIVSKEGVVATNPPRAVVYVEGPFPREESPRTVQLAQKDLAFIPSLLPIQTGTRVEFPNYDDTFHNVFSFSPAKRFDLGRYRPTDLPVPSQVFDLPGLVTLRCEIHQHMRALILVLESPYFVVTDANGNYRLEGVPPGTRVLKAWISSKATRARTVEIEGAGPLRVDFP